MQIEFPDILKSKKFFAAAGASVMAFVGYHNGLSTEQIAVVTGPFYAFIGGQALADMGKEKAKVEADHQPTIIHSSPAPPPPPVTTTTTLNS